MGAGADEDICRGRDATHEKKPPESSDGFVCLSLKTDGSLHHFVDSRDAEIHVVGLTADEIESVQEELRIGLDIHM